MRGALVSPAAYELLLKGRVLLWRRGRAIIESRVCLERSVALDPSYPEALGLLAECYRLHGHYGLAQLSEMMPLARATAERALKIDVDQEQAQATLANLAATYEWDGAKATRIYMTLLARHPNCVPALCERAIWLSMMPSPQIEPEQGFAWLQRALTADPLNAWAYGMQSLAYLLVEKLEDALATARRAVELDANNFAAQWTLVMALAALKRPVEAISAATNALPMSGRHTWLLAEIAAAHAALGDAAAAQVIHVELQQRSEVSHVGWAERAAVAASAGYIDEARAWAQKAFDARDLFLLSWKITAFAVLRADADCNRIVRLAGA